MKLPTRDTLITTAVVTLVVITVLSYVWMMHYGYRTVDQRQLGNNRSVVNGRSAERQQTTGAVWHTIKVPLLALEVAVPVTWSFKPGPSNYPILYGDLIADDGQSYIRFIKEQPLQGEHTIEDLFRGAQALSPTLTTLDGLPAVQGYGATPALSETINYSVKEFQLFTRTGQYYAISYNCPDQHTRQICDQVISTMHFK